MGFFDDARFPARPGPEEEPQQPEWFGAPEDWIGGVVPLELRIARSEQAAIYLTALVAYPTGFALTVNAVTRKPTNLGLDAFPFGPPVTGTGEGVEPAPELLRYGIEYPDGRRATSFGGFFQNSTGGSLLAVGEGPGPDPAKDLILTAGGGSGGSRQSEQHCWVWPLPPREGEVVFVCEWPLFDIAESSVDVEAAVIHGAADRALAVWQ